MARYRAIATRALKEWWYLCMAVEPALGLLKEFGMIVIATYYLRAL